MERDTIIEKAKTLPISELSAIPEDNDIWEVEEEGLKFMLIKNPLPLPSRPPIYSLSVSGLPEKIQQTITEFTEVFGEPQITDMSQGGVFFLSWLADGVDERLSSEQP